MESRIEHLRADGVSHAAATLLPVLLVVVVLLAVTGLAVRRPAVEQGGVAPAAARPAGTASSPPAGASGTAQPGFLYGRVTDAAGAVYEGRLRWGGDEEAFWGDFFNGTKMRNPWAAYANPATPPGQRTSIEIFGFEFGGDRATTLDRQFLARFGDILRIERHIREVQVTLKSGTALTLDRFEAGDIDDGIRVWDQRRGVVDLDSGRIRTIEFLPTAASLIAPPVRLHGTVRTRQGDFTGFIQWDRQDCIGSDTLDGRSSGNDMHLRYDTIRSIARRSRDSAMVTLLDGRELVLSEGRDVGHGSRGIYVDDRRYGRVLVSWDAFERADFSAADSGPAYAAFAAGRALAGSVATRDGRRHTGRLVFDFDESETTETLDGAIGGVDYNIPFGLVTAVLPNGSGRTDERRDRHRATVVLRSGEAVQFERSGDLGEGNAGMLIFADGVQRPQYVRWTDVERIDFDGAADAPQPGR